MQTNQISVTVAGANRVELVEKLRAFADNLDGTPATADGKVSAGARAGATGGSVGGKTAGKQKTGGQGPAVMLADDDDDFKTEKASDAGFDDDAPDEGFTDDPPPAKAQQTKKAAPKPKKLTLDDVNDACKAYASANGREATLAILQKKFKTQSVSALKPEQYEACIAAMKVD